MRESREPGRDREQRDEQRTLAQRHAAAAREERHERPPEADEPAHERDALEPTLVRQAAHAQRAVDRRQRPAVFADDRDGVGTRHAAEPRQANRRVGAFEERENRSVVHASMIVTAWAARQVPNGPGVSASGPTRRRGR